MEQLCLPLVSDERDLRERLESSLRRPVHLVLTDNHVSMIRVRTAPDGVRLRLHRIFLDAGDEVLREVARFARTRKKPGPLIGDFIRGHLRDRPEQPPRSVRIEPRGRHYNLQVIFDKINQIYFDGRLSVPITWSQGKASRHVRRRILGSYSSRTGTIRIHPWLDRKTVPPFVLEYVVYHEMLHADLGAEVRNGRRVVHSAEFRRRERLYARWNEAEAWRG
jgi:hypothetical protein